MSVHICKCIVCVCVCRCINTYVHVCKCMSVCPSVWVRMYMCVGIWICVHMRRRELVYVCMWVWVCGWFLLVSCQVQDWWWLWWNTVHHTIQEFFTQSWIEIPVLYSLSNLSLFNHMVAFQLSQIFHWDNTFPLCLVMKIKTRYMFFNRLIIIYLLQLSKSELAVAQINPRGSFCPHPLMWGTFMPLWEFFNVLTNTNADPAGLSLKGNSKVYKN